MLEIFHHFMVRKEKEKKILIFNQCPRLVNSNGLQEHPETSNWHLNLTSID